MELGEAIDAERVLGVGMDGWSSAMEMAALLFIASQRAGLELSWEDVRRLKPSDVVRVPGDDEDATSPPDAAGDEPATPTATPKYSST